MEDKKPDVPIEDVYNQTTLLKEIIYELRAIRKNVKNVELELSVIKILLKK